ncbi:putative cell division protein kinase (Ctk1) [Aspergillus tanneri]|uniref:cyclin-dependent kinase n=1 Tax=Aspergillus tanneri TaxID=1220188 RepID=A0A5M9N274_9EURO|nr:uncharacterized protein ATNIH1004_000646 [Aspergillus tanneri]KAA8651750.1 hypothetical protein ATNIH1004_000646 [Aspergillus tanneri]
MTASDWRKSLGFTDRLTAIQSLTTAYQRASSAAAFTEAQSQAKRFESEAYEQAASKEEYDGFCQEAIDAAESLGSVDPVISSTSQSHNESEEESWTAGENIGPYQSCVHHYDGLHSTIYKSKAEDGTLVAVKVTIPHLLTEPHDAEREVQLLREAASARVIPLREALKLGGRLILVFPFMKYDFEQLLRRDMLTATQARSHLQDMFNALVHIHEMGIIHRDIKPSNILLDSPDGPAYLADFGIAWKEGLKTSEPADRKIIDVGTTCYRPPEILFGFKGYGAALDLWAAGCVVAETIAVGHKQLFDSGPLGSDLSLIHSIFKTLGTPDENSWPVVQETRNLPDWDKVQFYIYPAQPWDAILKGASSKGRDLVSQLALGHPYFSAT